MKNIFLLLCFSLFLLPVTYAQAPLSNLEGNASSISSKLGAALSLTDVQKPKILDVVTAFLKQRANILPLARDNEKAYDTKLNSFHNGFYRKLKAILKPEQYEQFLQLKPPTNDGTNVLSQLFY